MLFDHESWFASKPLPLIGEKHRATWESVDLQFAPGGIFA